MYQYALGAVMGLNSLYSAAAARSNYRAVKRYTDYQERYYAAYNRENTRYWNDYIRKHHLQNRVIRYPYRKGYVYNMSSLYGAGARQVSSRNSAALAFMRTASPVGLYHSAGKPTRSMRFYR